MSRWGKVIWLLCGLAFVILAATRFILGGWMPFMWMPFFIFITSFVVAVFIDIKFYLEFLTMRTTKHGMNMGAMIVLAVALIVAVNILGVLKNKTWDLTEEKLNSLSSQSETVIDGLKGPVVFYVFYRGAKDKKARDSVKASLDVYRQYSGKVKVRAVNAYVDNVMAEKYLKGLNNADRIVLFVEYAGKKARVEFPFTEESITSGLIKASRQKATKVYFLTGHGERDLKSEENEGLTLFKKALQDSSFEVESLSLIEKENIPQDAEALAIVGAKMQFLDVELQKVIAYVRSGGKLFLAVDPGQRHQLANLTKSFGIEFRNNYIVSDHFQIQGRGRGSAIGVMYDTSNEITKSFRSGQVLTVFDIASEVVKSSGAPSDIQYSELVRTHPSSYTVGDIGTKLPNVQRRLVNLAIAARGKWSKEEEKESAVVVFGDSDFISNKSLLVGMNRDLALNAMADLVGEKDLVSIRPKQAKGTKLQLTTTTKSVVVLAGALIPILLLILGGFFWYRRRST